MPTGEITSLLRAWSQGDAAARDRLASLVYKDLRRVAGARMRGRTRPSLSPTDVVHDVFVRLLGQEARWVNRAHFFAVAAEMVRRVLVDRARARLARKRGGGALRVDLSDVEVVHAGKDVDVLALDRALEELSAQDARQARVVVLHFFGGLTFDEIGEELGVSASAAKREWQAARVWLLWRLGANEPARRGRA
jgi:RNA polymerase sigma factor (TIGR02999 family)